MFQKQTDMFLLQKKKKKMPEMNDLLKKRRSLPILATDKNIATAKLKLQIALC